MMTRQRPRTITIAASDVMKWLRPTMVTKKPMIMPIMLLARMPTSEAVQGSTPARNSEPASTMAKQTTEPTARSMPPTIKRIVMPTTTMPSTEKLISMARMLPKVRKCGEAKLMTIPSARMIAISPASRIVPMRFQAGACLSVATIVSTAISASPALSVLSGDMCCPACCDLIRLRHAGRQADHRLLAHIRVIKLAGDRALPYHQHPVAKPKQFRQFR
ncbi:hypothetical protein D9M72_418730 [compost metagenome]